MIFFFFVSELNLITFGKNRNKVIKSWSDFIFIMNSLTGILNECFYLCMNNFIPRLEQFQLFTKTETFKRGSLGTKIVDEASSWPVVKTYVTEPTAEGL